MPCWYFDRKEIRSSPSSQDGIDQATENRYRREGARLILDAGTKMGLRYDTCATGVVFFHRFYMFHSFREFHRYVMSACCLFLAGKTEETPKKCKDIIRTAQSLLSVESFQVFGEDPREEVMTMERILLQTVKFDLQVEHPYGFLLNYAKQIKGDKEKIQKMAQMSWTFINDSMCTTLCLQWEPEIIAVSLMYLASRLTKFDPTDWTGRISGSKSKWWEDLIEGMTMDLMEDICHQVLDLYSAQQEAQKQDGREVSPPLSAVPRGPRSSGPRDTPPPPPKEPPPKKRKTESQADSSTASAKAKTVKREREEETTRQSSSAADSAPSSETASPNLKTAPGNGSSSSSRASAAPVNPYMSSSMYTSSFLSQEGQQSIQSLLGGTPSTSNPQMYPNYPPPSTPGHYPPPPGPYTPVPYTSGPTGYTSEASQFSTPSSYSGSYNVPTYGQAPPSTYSSTAPPSSVTSSSYQPLPYSAPPPNLPPPPAQGFPSYPASGYPPMNQPPPAGPPPPFPPPGFGGPPPGSYSVPPPRPTRGRGGRPNQNNLTPVRHMSDRSGMR